MSVQKGQQLTISHAIITKTCFFLLINTAPPQKTLIFQSLGPVNGTLRGNRDFAVVLKFALLRGRVYLGYQFGPNAIIGVLIKGRQENPKQREKGNVVMKAAKD